MSTGAAGVELGVERVVAGVVEFGVAGGKEDDPGGRAADGFDRWGVGHADQQFQAFASGQYDYAVQGVCNPGPVQASRS